MPSQGGAGYRLYVRQIGQMYGGGVDVGLLPPDVHGIVHYVYGGLAPGVINYFAVTVYDASGGESARSNELSLLVAGTPPVGATAMSTPISPLPTQQATTRTSTLTPTPTATREIGAGCAATPVRGCLTPGRSKLSLKGPGENSKLRWTWRKGTTTVADFGDPLNGSSSYRLCIYDEAAGVPRLMLGASAPASGRYAGKACWTRSGPPASNGSRYKYKDPNLTPDGLHLIKLKAGTGKARIVVEGKGANLPPTTAFSQDTNVTVQLVRSDGGVCWQAEYPAPAIKNIDSQFKDHTP